MKNKMIDTLVNWDSLYSESHETPQGLFMYYYVQHMADENPVLTWLTEDIAKNLDIEYYFHHSGDKFISRLYEWMYKSIGESVDGNETKEKLMETVVNKFALSWNKIYSAIVENYNPLENYDMEQKETPDITHTKTVKQNVTTENKVYGFNSSSAVPQSESVVDGAKLNNEEENKESGTRSLERHGNIGVTTSQQMLQSEIDLRSNYHFMNQIMDDVDSMLCLLVY